MGDEKRGSKGSFLQLFDWNVKSRKKLFSNKSELPDGSKQGKENLVSSSISQLPEMKQHENGFVPNLRASSDYNGASSLNVDERFQTKAPGVVARLMGLDSLPTSIVPESSFTSFLDFHSFRDSHSLCNAIGFQSENDMADYGSMRNKLDGFSINPAELRRQRVYSRPIERFQTEILPPKSAKSIPITHHRLLSPVKNPAFVPSKSAAYIMEAAAKIIEQSPQSTITKRKPPSFGSSVPLRMPDLKERPEAAQKYRQRQLFKPSSLSKNVPETSKRKDNSVSLAVQAKVNVQTREGNRSSARQKVDKEVRLSHLGKNKASTQKSARTRSAACRTSDVLKQNNQKQNHASIKDGTSLKSSVSHHQDRKILSESSSRPSNRTVNKVVVNNVAASRRVNFKERSSSKTENFLRKKQPDGDVDNALMNKSESSVKCNVAVDGCVDWGAVDRKVGMDVVSFTFTSPIKKTMPEPPPGKLMERNNSFCRNLYDDQLDSNKSTLSSFGLNVIGGDALSVLLEHKLKELTCRVESSHTDLVNEASASCSAPTLIEVNTSTGQENKFLADDNANIEYDFNSSSVDKLLLRSKQSCLGREEISELSNGSNNSGYEKELDCEYSSPGSNLQPSFSDGSCSLSNGNITFISEGSHENVSSESHETVSWISAEKPQPSGAETELSDSASSIFTGNADRIDVTIEFSSTGGSSCWVLQYIRDIFQNTVLTSTDFALEHKVIRADLFDQLENQKAESYKNSENFVIQRRVLFECVSDCIEFRRERLLNGNSRSWEKCMMIFSWKERLAEEIYREICGWASMEDLMVDEVVDKDMSTQYGKWADFEMETFEQGVEIEKIIFASLIGEVISDFLLV